MGPATVLVAMGTDGQAEVLTVAADDEVAGALQQCSTASVVGTASIVLHRLSTARRRTYYAGKKVSHPCTY